MNRFFALIFLLLAGTAVADELPTPGFKEPLNVGWDKPLHFAAGALAGEYGRVATKGLAKALHFNPDSKWVNVVAPIVSATLAGTAKEILDSRQKGNKFDPQDLAATVLGSLPASGIRLTWNFDGPNIKAMKEARNQQPGN